MRPDQEERSLSQVEVWTVMVGLCYLFLTCIILGILL